MIYNNDLSHSSTSRGTCCRARFRKLYGLINRSGYKHSKVTKLNARVSAASDLQTRQRNLLSCMNMGGLHADHITLHA